MITVAVGCIRRDGSVLLCQRTAEATYPLKWEFPGGKLERGETPEECLKRELREELDVSATIGTELHRQRIVYPDAGEFDVIYFAVDSFEGEPENRVFSQIRWVHPGDLKHYDVLEGNKEMVRLIAEGEVPSGLHRPKGPLRGAKSRRAEGRGPEPAEGR